MIKKLNVMMTLVLCCVFSLNSMDSKSPEDQFIARSIEKNEIALKNYHVLLQKSFKGLLSYSSFEAKCLRNTCMASIAPNFSWGFKWLVLFVANRENGLHIDYLLDTEDQKIFLEYNATLDLEALKNIKQKASKFILEPSANINCTNCGPHQNVNNGRLYSGAIGIKRSKPQQSYDAHSSDLVAKALNHCHGGEEVKLYMRNEFLQAHVKKQFSYYFNDTSYFKDTSRKFAISENENLIKETVAQHLARLKKENPVDTNPITNKYAELLNKNFKI